MNRTHFREGALLVVPAVVIPLVIVLAGQGSLAPPQAALPGPAVLPGNVQAAEVSPEAVRIAPAPARSTGSAARTAEPASVEARPISPGSAGVAPSPAQASRTAPGASAESPAAELPPEPVPASPTDAATATRAASVGTAAEAPGTAPAMPPASSETAPAQAAASPLARGRQLTRLFYTERLGEVWAAFLPAARAEWNDLAAFQVYRESGRDTYGAETRVLREEIRQAAGLTYYLRTATFERGPNIPWTTIVGMNPEGQVQTFGIVEASLLPEAQGTDQPAR